ncbi:MAG: hypothetical protein KDK78_02085 [Chlamydiia bacterium]|nr:hypothetical protein [Chlamydiia bacterium]
MQSSPISPAHNPLGPEFSFRDLCLSRTAESDQSETCTQKWLNGIISQVRSGATYLRSSEVEVESAFQSLRDLEVAEALFVELEALYEECAAHPLNTESFSVDSRTVQDLCVEMGISKDKVAAQLQRFHALLTPAQQRAMFFCLSLKHISVETLKDTHRALSDEMAALQEHLKAYPEDRTVLRRLTELRRYERALAESIREIRQQPVGIVAAAFLKKVATLDELLAQVAPVFGPTLSGIATVIAIPACIYQTYMSMRMISVEFSEVDRLKAVNQELSNIVGDNPDSSTAKLAVMKQKGIASAIRDRRVTIAWGASLITCSGLTIVLPSVQVILFFCGMSVPWIALASLVTGLAGFGFTLGVLGYFKRYEILRALDPKSHTLLLSSELADWARRQKRLERLEHYILTRKDPPGHLTREAWRVARQIETLIAEGNALRNEKNALARETGVTGFRRRIHHWLRGMRLSWDIFKIDRQARILESDWHRRQPQLYAWAEKGQAEIHEVRKWELEQSKQSLGRDAAFQATQRVDARQVELDRRHARLKLGSIVGRESLVEIEAIAELARNSRIQRYEICDLALLFVEAHAPEALETSVLKKMLRAEILLQLRRNPAPLLLRLVLYSNQYPVLDLEHIEGVIDTLYRPEGPRKQRPNIPTREALAREYLSSDRVRSELSRLICALHFRDWMLNREAYRGTAEGRRLAALAHEKLVGLKADVDRDLLAGGMAAEKWLVRYGIEDRSGDFAPWVKALLGFPEPTRPLDDKRTLLDETLSLMACRRVHAEGLVTD